MSFAEVLSNYSWSSVYNDIHAKNAQDVKTALSKKHRNLEDFKALISPAAEPFLEEMAVLSNAITQKRFGKTIQLYIPLYLSNECSNHCIYCGFNHENKIDRLTLNQDQIRNEVDVIKSYGYDHILLVTGESRSKAGVEYLQRAMEQIRPYFSLISIEVQPLDTEEYAILSKSGLHTVYVYQETYRKETYGTYHLKGKKSDFDYRLETPERIGKAGIHRIGLGCLLGLEDWRADSFCTALHLNYLEKMFWKTKYSVSFPRLRPHEGNFEPQNPMSDKELVQLICAYRLLNEEVELSISVRESRTFRDNIIKLGITSLSAGSKTEPGGYSNYTALQQFDVHDSRTPEEMASVIKNQGYEVVWKDWDSYM